MSEIVVSQKLYPQGETILTFTKVVDADGKRSVSITLFHEINDSKLILQVYAAEVTDFKDLKLPGDEIDIECMDFVSVEDQQDKEKECNVCCGSRRNLEAA